MPLSAVRIFLWCTLLLAGTANAEASLEVSASADEKSAERGQRIYEGREGIKAKIAGHGEWLLPASSKCINCHSGQRPSASAPPLTRSWLTEVRPRRGGPAFAYDLSSFCKTLRVGIDPEYVMLNRTMPRFDISNHQCAALWAYLTEEPDNEKKRK